jgi:hypothetical protein
MVKHLCGAIGKTLCGLKHDSLKGTEIEFLGSLGSSKPEDKV